MSRRRDQLSQSDEHNARGIELADRGWLDEAVIEFEKAIELDPESAHARDNLATVLAEKGQLFDALAQYVEAIKVDPENPSAHHYLASFLAGQGADLAVASYRRSLELDDEAPETHLNLGLALADRGALEEALTELQVAHRQAPEDDGIAHELACCLIDLERYPEAIGLLKRITKTNPELVEAQIDLGIAYTAQGFYDEANRSFQQALTVDPHDMAAHYHYAALLAVSGQPSPALEHLEVAAQSDRDRVRQWLRDDRMFDAYRSEPRFLALFDP